jgi:hypothetical protein
MRTKPAETKRRTTREEKESLLDFVIARKKEFVQEFLRDRKLAFSGTKEEMRSRLEQYIVAGKVSIDELVAFLDSVEGWGNQHVFLYRAPPKATKLWSSEENARAVLRKHKLENLFNRPRPVLIPDEPQLSTIEWTRKRVRFLWVQRRVWHTRLEGMDLEDEDDPDIEYRAYKRHEERAISHFDWHFLGGQSMLLLRAYTGADYQQDKSEYENLLEPLVGLSDFTELGLDKVIKTLRESDEVRRRETDFKTIEGSGIRLTSSSSDRDTLADPLVRKLSDDLVESAISGRFGNFYWKPCNELDREIAVRIYVDHQGSSRVNIPVQCTEEEVLYVLSRIRAFNN